MDNNQVWTTFEAGYLTQLKKFDVINEDNTFEREGYTLKVTCRDRLTAYRPTRTMKKQPLKLFKFEIVDARHPYRVCRIPRKYKNCFISKINTLARFERFVTSLINQHKQL